MLSDFLRLFPLLVLGLAASYFASRFGAPLGGDAADQHAAEIRDLRSLSAAEFKSAEPGSDVLVSGRIAGQLEPGYRGLVIVRVQSPQSGQASPFSRSPAFLLTQTEGAVPVLADTYQDKIWNAPHHGQTGGQMPKEQPRGEEVVYDGFQEGEIATAKGKVVVKDGQKSIEAQVLLGGTPEEFLKSRGGSGLATFLNIVGLFFILLFCLTFARRIRRRRRASVSSPLVGEG